MSAVITSDSPFVNPEATTGGVGGSQQMQINPLPTVTISGLATQR